MILAVIFCLGSFILTEYLHITLPITVFQEFLSYEEQAYWRDVGDIDTFYTAHHDVMGGEPKFNLFNPSWFINSSNYQGPSPRILSGDIQDSVIGAGFIR